MSLKNNLYAFSARGAQVPTNQSARITRLTIATGDRYVVTFTSGQELIWTVPQLPDSYQGGTLALDVLCVCPTATSGNVTLTAAVEAIASGDNINVDTSTSFATANSTTTSVPGSSGHPFVMTISLTHATVADQNMVRVKLTRGSDTASGALQVISATLYETVTTIDYSGASVSVGSLSTGGQITSTLATGTAPLVVASTTKVVNLNADQLDGLDSTAFQNASNITSGTLPAARLPSPTISTLGGVKSHAATTHQYLTQIGTDGSVSAGQPAASDITGLATSATTDTTSASNITSGTLDDARLSTNVTRQGNTFNTANNLVKLDGATRLPAVDGRNLTNISATATPAGTNGQLQYNNGGTLGALPGTLFAHGSATNNIDGIQTRQLVVDYLGEARCDEVGGNTQGLWFGAATGTGIVCVQDGDGDYILKFYVNNSAVAYLGADGSWNQGTPDCGAMPDQTQIQWSTDNSTWHSFTADAADMDPIVVDQGGTLYLRDQGSGALTYSIDFGDGGSDTAVPTSHVYDTAGPYSGNVELTDGPYTYTANYDVAVGSAPDKSQIQYSYDNSTWTNYDPIVEPYDLGEISTADVLYLRDNGSGGDGNSSIDWGDGNSNYNLPDNHSYDAGSYTITVDVSNGGWLSTLTFSVSVSGGDAPPADLGTLEYRASPDDGSWHHFGSNPLTYHIFDDQPIEIQDDGTSSLNYSIDWGDGSGAETGSYPLGTTHDYGDGDYTIQITLDNGAGDTATQTINLTVDGR